MKILLDNNFSGVKQLPQRQEKGDQACRCRVGRRLQSVILLQRISTECCRLEVDCNLRHWLIGRHHIVRSHQAKSRSQSLILLY